MTDRKPKPAPHFEVCFPSQYPEGVSVRAVADAIGAIQALVQPDRPDEGTSEDGFSVRIVDIVRGSAIYRCVSSEPDYMVPRLKLVGDMIQQNRGDPHLGAALPHVRQLSEIARQTSTSIEVRLAGDHGRNVILTITPETYGDLKATHTFSGSTVMVGDLRRIGGATRPRCMIRALGQSAAVYCDITYQQARELAPFLYDRVVLEGNAVWLAATKDILEFTVSRVVPHKKRSFREARRLLREAGADAWDTVDDPEAFVHGEASGGRT